MEEPVRRIAGPERPSIPLAKIEPRAAGQRHDFALRLAEQLFLGTKHYAPWRSERKMAPDRSRRIASPLAERPKPASAGVINDLSRRGRALAKEKASDPAPYGEDPSTNRVSQGGRYSRLDCYEFVAAVLEGNGIRYYGKDGVGRALVEKAKMEHKPSNHFLTGEGLTGLLSSDMASVHVKGESVQQVWEALEPRLKEGAILSFSSRRAGHTGIVGLRNGRWVFINSSGKLGEKRSYRVKEEDLEEEIRSRLAKAKNEKSPLSITLGQVDRGLAAAYRKPEFMGMAETRQGRVSLLV